MSAFKYDRVDKANIAVLLVEVMAQKIVALQQKFAVSPLPRNAGQRAGVQMAEQFGDGSEDRSDHRARDVRLMHEAMHHAVEGETFRARHVEIRRAIRGQLQLPIEVVRHLPVSAPSWGWRIVPYGIGAVAMFWVIERTVAFGS